MEKLVFDDVTGFPLWFPKELRNKRFLTFKDLPECSQGFCRFCGRKVGNGGIWCNSECRDGFLIRSSGLYVADKVFCRDSGICCVCGIDAVEAYNVMLFTYKTPEFFSSRGKKRWGPWHSNSVKNRFWEADHIVPVSEGGGCCGLKNYRTLCLPCHKNQTMLLSHRKSGATRFFQTSFEF